MEEAGCDFIPLVVEAFGAWSPFALKSLNVIADRTTARSGCSTSKKALAAAIVSITLDQQCQDDFKILGFTGRGH